MTAHTTGAGVARRRRPVIESRSGLLALVLTLVSGAVIAAEPAGTVLYTRGAASAQTPGASMRLVGPGAPLAVNDVVSTGPKSFAVVELGDKTRVVLRANTRFAVESWNAAPGAESAVLRLFAGGLRAVTGWLNKTRPGAVAFRTSTATIGIRGTDFAARVCQDDCASDAKVLRRIEGGMTAVAARVVLVQGELTRTDGPDHSIPLQQGAAIYGGDILETGKASQAVLAFRDGTRIALGAQTRFAVEKYRYDEAEPSNDGIFLRLVRGGLRALTGAIAKANPASFKIGTTVATIGIRGTGFDLKFPDACQDKSGKAAEGLGAGVWKGRIALEESQHEVGEGEAACVTELGGTATRQSRAPKVDAPRPDEVPVPEDLFAEAAVSGTATGLHASTFDGEIVINTEGGAISVGRGENGWASATDSRTPPVRYSGDQPIARIDGYFNIDPRGTPADWDGFDPNAVGSAGMCPLQ